MSPAPEAPPPLRSAALTVHTADRQGEILVLDSRGRLLQRGFGPSRVFALDPGIYRVKVLTGDEFQEKSIVLGGGPLAVRFPPVAFASPVPLAGTSTLHAYHVEAADRESRVTHLADGTGSSLFFLVRDWTPKSQTSAPRITANPAEGLSLHEVTGNNERKLCDLAVSGAHNAAGEPWAACTIAVGPGVYQLRLDLPGVEPLRQSVVASPGWQTQSFLFMRRYAGDAGPIWRADLSRTSVLIAPAGGGFSPNEPMLRLAELARVALATRRASTPGQPQRRLMPEEMRTLLREKFINPMLGIYGAHLLLMEGTGVRSRVVEVVRNLRALLPGHPDVEALALRAAGEPPPQPFEHPPMLRRSWSLIVEASMTRPSLVADSPGAPTMLEAADGPWHIWRTEPESAPTDLGLAAPLELSDVELALAEDLGLMKGVRRTRARLADRPDSGTARSVSRDVPASQAFEMLRGDEASAAPNEESAHEHVEVHIDSERMRSVAARFGMLAPQLQRALKKLELKLTTSAEAPNVTFLVK